MRSIVHQILARYLGSEQHAFDASPRELWPEPWSETHRQADARAPGRADAQDSQPGIYDELETQNCA